MKTLKAYEIKKQKYLRSKKARKNNIFDTTKTKHIQHLKRTIALLL